MPVPETVKTLASSFEGLNGAIALSVIAFSVVFLVLIGLTVVIFAMRLVSKIGIPAAKPAPAPAKAVKAAPVPAPAPAPAAVPVAAAVDDSEEIVAVIAAAVAAFVGSGVTVTSVVPAAPAAPAAEKHLIGTDNVAWIACGRLEGLQGALSDRW